MGYLVNSRFVEGLLNDAETRQYMVEVRLKWRLGTPFRFDTLVQTIAEACMGAGYQPQEVQNASRPMGDTMGTAVFGPLRMTVPGTLTLGHANCTLVCTSRAAFVCQKMTRSFSVFPPEN